ncbi:hypothetical protein Mapa_014230 [Marchantia paleacea]|nr:hypothetical protein Mapa_014230 [Marchantia paleacea]
MTLSIALASRRAAHKSTSAHESKLSLELPQQSDPVPWLQLEVTAFSRELQLSALTPDVIVATRTICNTHTTTRSFFISISKAGYRKKFLLVPSGPNRIEQRGSISLCICPKEFTLEELQIF